MFRRTAVLASLLLTAACAGDTIAPTTVVVGRFGGRGTELVASADHVRVQFACGFAEYDTPIVPEPDGRFSLGPVLVPTRTGTGALAIKGVVSADEIEFDAVVLSSSGQVTSTHHVVHLDQPADYSGLACLANVRN